MSSGKRNNIAQQQFSFFDCDRIINQLTKRAIESNLVGEENRKFVDVCVPQRHVKNARNLCDLLFIANRSSLGWMAGGPRNGPKINFECGSVIFARHRPQGKDFVYLFASFWRWESQLKIQAVDAYEIKTISKAVEDVTMWAQGWFMGRALKLWIVNHVTINCQRFTYEQSYRSFKFFES